MGVFLPPSGKHGEWLWYRIWYRLAEADAALLAPGDTVERFWWACEARAGSGASAGGGEGCVR